MVVDFNGRVAIVTGAWIGTGGDAPEQLALQLDAVRSRDGEMVPESGSAQGQNEVARAAAAVHAG